MKLNIMPIIALTYEEGYALWEKAQARSDVLNFIFYLAAFYAMTYTMFFCITGIAGWYKNIRHAPLIIFGGLAVIFVIMIVAGNRSLYWYSWKPNFLASS